MSTNPSVALVSGFWGQNIGNAFFNVGGLWILQQVFGAESVAYIQDQPGYRTFNNKMRGNPKNDLGLLKHLDVEYIVLQGPMLTTSFEALWGDTFEALTRRGTKIILLSAAFFHYTEQEIAAVRRFLAKYPPALISTRDAHSYEIIKDLAEYTYSGIDSAFFAPKAYNPPKLSIPSYVAINFDQYPEPNFTVALEGSNLPPDQFDITFDALGSCWGAHQPALQMNFANRGQWQTYLGALLDFRRLPTALGKHLVVRTAHRFNPHVTWKIYQQKNAVASDEPFTYFTIYNGAALTLSDRVHACVATLAYGNPAMLFTPTPRARLFERVGATDIRRRPVVLDLDYLESERQQELNFLQQALASSPHHDNHVDKSCIA